MGKEEAVVVAVRLYQSTDVSCVFTLAQNQLPTQIAHMEMVFITHSHLPVIANSESFHNMSGASG
jgi:hypothetical protein